MMRDPDTATRIAATAALEVSGLVKAFRGARVLDGVSLAIGHGEILAVTGPSGAGKTTLARLLSGLEKADAGTVRLNHTALLPLAPQDRHVAHMFESYALYPGRSVFDNIASPLHAPRQAGRFGAADIAQRVEEVMALTEIAHLRARLPSQLSGGQKQRVALCRTLVQDPALFILDEPIGHLDAKLRHKLRGDLRRRLHLLDQPTLWLTPDAVEALAIGDRVAVLMDGVFLQVGTPEEIHLRPADVRVARLVGDPAMNVFDVTLERDGTTLLVRHAGGTFAASGALAARFDALGRAAGCSLGVRPTDIGLAVASADVPGAGPAVDALAGEVYAVEPFGKYSLVTVTPGTAAVGARLRVKQPGAATCRIGERVTLSIDPARLCLFDAGTGKLLHSTTSSSPIQP